MSNLYKNRNRENPLGHCTVRNAWSLCQLFCWSSQISWKFALLVISHHRPHQNFQSVQSWITLQWQTCCIHLEQVCPSDQSYLVNKDGKIWHTRTDHWNKSREATFICISDDISSVTSSCMCKLLHFSNHTSSLNFCDFFY